MKKDRGNNITINWKLWAGLLISALFLYLASLQVDFARTWMILTRADISFLLLAILVALTQFLVRAWRWRILLYPLKDTVFLNRLLCVLIGFAANCVLPARLGEFIRANYLGRMEKISKSAAFGTVVIERIFDGFFLFLILVIGIMSTTFPSDYSELSASFRGTAVSFFSIYLLIIAFIIGFKYKTSQFIQAFNRVLFFLPSGLKGKIIEVIHNFSMGLVPLKGIYNWIQVIFYSTLLWSISLVQVQFIEYSIGIDLPFIATFIIQAMAFIGVAIPLAPGYIGPFHLAVQYGFIFYGIAREEALSAAILLHASFFFPTILFGLIAFICVQVLDSRNPEDSAVQGRDDIETK